jgi:diguanylate cyclase (GGDEF)-like protein
VLYLDVDHFKALNTRYTERVVDRDVLPALHRAVADASCEHGFAYAEGGDEMVVLLRNCGELMGLAFAESLRASIEALPLSVDRAPVRLTVSVGLASSPPCDLRELPERANQAKAEAKRVGRNAVCVARPDGVRRVHVRADAAPANKPAMWRGAFR